MPCSSLAVARYSKAKIQQRPLYPLGPRRQQKVSLEQGTIGSLIPCQAPASPYGFTRILTNYLAGAEHRRPV